MDSTPRKVWVNGSLMDPTYLHDSVEEAKGCAWDMSTLPKDPQTGHVHCLICGLAIPADGVARAFKSESRWLCRSCWHEFIAPDLQ